MKYKIGEMVKFNGDKCEVCCIVIDKGGTWYSVSGTGSGSYRSVAEDKLTPWVDAPFVEGAVVVCREQVGQVEEVGERGALVAWPGDGAWYRFDELGKAEPVALITRPGATGAAIGGYFNREPYWILLPGQMLVATNDSGRPIYPGEQIRIRAEKL